MTASSLPPQQEALLRLLDTRMACLLVDRPATEVLRRNLFALRDKLARDRLDTATLREVETTMRALVPRQTIDDGPVAAPPQRSHMRPRGAVMSRMLSGVAGLTVFAALLAGAVR